MAVQYGEFKYDHHTDGIFIDWLESKDDDGWELVCIMEQSAVIEGKYTCICVFRKNS